VFHATPPPEIFTLSLHDALPIWNWIPFGAGRHRCVGAAFAMMQLKTIFCILLRDWELTAAQPPETYRNDHSKMVVQLAQPCMVRYRRRSGPTVVEDGSPTGESA